MDYEDHEDANPFLLKGPAKSLLIRRALGPFNKEKKVPLPMPVTAFTEDQIKVMFRRYDTDGDGRLSKKELKNAFNAFGSRLPGFRVALALNYADANGDGYIDQAEFDTLVKYAFKRGYNGPRN